MVTFPIYSIYPLIFLLFFYLIKNIVSCVERKRKTETNLHSCNGIISKRSKTWIICFHRHLHLQFTTKNFFLDTLHVITEKKKKTELLPSYCKVLTIIPRILINVHAHVPSNETLYEFIRQEFPYREGESLVEAHASSNETTSE